MANSVEEMRIAVAAMGAAVSRTNPTAAPTHAELLAAELDAQREWRLLIRKTYIAGY